MTLSVDTNLLIYAIDATAGTRHERAKDIVDRLMGGGRGVLILQTLGEFYSVATRKLGTSPKSVRCLVSDFRAALKVHAADEGALDFAMAAVEDILSRSGTRCSGRRRTGPASAIS